MKQQLHDAASLVPQFSKTILNSNSDKVLCADPNITRALVAIMDMHSVIGGAASHWGGPAALAEGMSALHEIMFKEANWYEHYNFVNDVGHAENGIYALRANLGFGGLTFNDLKKFRSIESKLTGHGESHLYPEGVLLSNGPLGSSIGQAQGLAMSDSLLKNNRITISVISDGACMEGEAKEAIAAIPGLFQKQKINPFLMMISDNNTKLSGRISEDSFAMGPSFSALESLGWEVRVVLEGNNLQACYQAIESSINALKSGSKPIALILKTVKGYGVDATEKSSSGGHGFPLKKGDGKLRSFIAEILDHNIPAQIDEMIKEIESLTFNKSSSDIPEDKIQAGFSEAMIEARQAGLPIVSISSDLQGSTGAAAFHKEYPDFSFDIGIAESNMVSAAAGFSKNGFIPVVDTFAAFGVTKGNLPLIMSRLSSCPMVCLFTHTGMQDAADGASHQSTTYFSALSSIPGVKIVNPSTKDEARYLLKEAFNKIHQAYEKNEEADSYVFFAGRETYPETLSQTYSLNNANILTEGTDLTLVATGPMVHLALKAAKKLQEKEISVEVINHSQINFPDIKTIGSSVTKTKKLITVEDHQLIGGMSSLLNHSLKENGYEYKLASIGLDNHFGRSAYSADELYKLFNIGVDAIVQKAEKFSR